jgi:hypothetical protein
MEIGASGTNNERDCGPGQNRGHPQTRNQKPEGMTKGE